MNESTFLNALLEQATKLVHTIDKINSNIFRKYSE